VSLHPALHDPGQASSVGLPADMEAADRADQFIPAGLASLGIEADEVDLAVMNAAHQMFWPAIRELLSRDLSAVEPERHPDLSRAPEDP
jgi:hypothetical protein